MDGPIDPLAHDATLNEVIGRVPLLDQATQLDAAVLPGRLSNTNYLVTADGSVEYDYAAFAEELLDLVPPAN